MLTLYYSPGACSLAPHIVLAEIGVPFELILVSTADGSTRSSKHLQVNPKGRVPVLDTEHERITEASAIMTWLALMHPEKELIANTPLGLARTIEWMNWLAGIHAAVIAQNWRTERFSDDESAHQKIQHKGMENLQQTYEQIESLLKDRTWAVADTYSVADPYLLVFFRWGNRLGLDMSQFPGWTEHAKNMQQREAVKSVLATEEISIWH